MKRNLIISLILLSLVGACEESEKDKKIAELERRIEQVEIDLICDKDTHGVCRSCLLSSNFKDINTFNFAYQENSWKRSYTISPNH